MIICGEPVCADCWAPCASNLCPTCAHNRVKDRWVHRMLMLAMALVLAIAGAVFALT